jgi:hypothetical protein
MPVLKFRVYWEEDETVYRDIVITPTQFFQDLHRAILVAYEFDSKHKASFYRSNDNWQRGREILLELDDRPRPVEPLLMADTTIGSTIKAPNQKFIYVYDYAKHWTFLVELIEISKEKSSKITYPSVVRSEGIGPSQYGTKGLIDDKLMEVEEKYDLNKEGMYDGYGEEGEETMDGDEDGMDAGADDTEF